MTDSVQQAAPAFAETTPVAPEVAQDSTSFLQSTPSTGLDGIDPVLRSDPSLKDFKSYTDLAKSYINAKSMIGSSIRIPSKEASPEAVAEFYSKLETVPGVMRFDENNPGGIYDKLGRPATPAEYRVEVPPEVTNDPAFSDFLQTSHKVGLNSQQVQELTNLQLKNKAAKDQAMTETVQHYQEQVRQEFGAEFQNRLTAANEAVRVWSQKYPDLQELLADPRVGNHPAIVSIFASLGKQAIEGNLPGYQANVQFGTSPAEAASLINEIRANRNHAYHNAKDPQHVEACEKVAQLSRIAYSVVSE